MTLVRVKETDSGGGFTVLNLQMVTRVECSGYGAGQQERRASVSFSDGGMVEPRNTRNGGRGNRGVGCRCRSKRPLGPGPIGSGRRGTKYWRRILCKDGPPYRTGAERTSS